MDLVIYLAAAIGFFLLVMASIGLHEIGHLVPGKLFGVKTTQYFVGFGRTLWSRRRGETEYGLKAIPLGGYVRFVGMFPPSKDRPGQVRAGRTGLFQSMADSARAAEYIDILPEDDGRLFYQKKPWQKLVIMAGGPLMNILLAFVILLGVTATYGVNRSTLTIAGVPDCIVSADATDRSCTGKPPSPAAQSGIRPGDTIVAFNGRPVSSWDEVSVAIRANLDQTAAISVLRGGERVELHPGADGDHRRARPLRPSQARRRGLLRRPAGHRAAAWRTPRRRPGHVDDDRADCGGAGRLPREGLLHRCEPGHRQASRRLRTDEHPRSQPGGR